MTRQEAPKGHDLLTQLVSEDPRLGVAIVRARDQLFITKYTLNGLSTPLALVAFQEGLVVRLNLPFSETRQAAKKGLANEGSLKRLEEVFQSNGPHVAFMRHGTQFSDNPDKIAMMRLPNNMTEPLTTQSLIQAAATAVAITEIARKTGKKIRVVSSENRRALQTAAVIAGVAKEITPVNFEVDQRLNCINYPPLDEMVEEELRKYLDAGGSLPWREDVVDAVCGEDTYQRITTNMRQVLDGSLGKGSDIITIIVTHTQQTQAVDTIFGEEPGRLRELGMRIAFPGQQQNPQTALFQSGIFAS
ncbi:histidine phosphatase family protein [Candidatus Microgenomates bacterium]|nr:histidine phosphatase family protein [Candidatus Microgenomates bacterium]